MTLSLLPFIMIQEISKKNMWIPVLVFLLLLLAVFLNLGIYPLYLEEPRRALISLEMLFNSNLWVPTEFGEYYYKKPPLFNWVIIAGYKLFGSYSEFAVRFFSVISYLSIGVITFWVGKKYVNLTFGVYAAFLFFICSDLLFYFTITTGEIDLFYSLLTYTSFIVLFHYYEKGNYWLLFALSYSLAALGTLTKGLPSIVFQGISILTIFIYNRNFKGLFKPSHFVGIFIYLLIVGGYALVYSQYNDPSLFLFSKDSIVSQSMERTPFENGFLKVFIHLFAFPLEGLKILAPGVLFLLLFISKKSRKAVFENRFISFCVIMFTANIWIYWISPGTASRYLYMFFPLAILICLFPLFQTPNLKIVSVIRYIFLFAIVMFCIASFSLPFIPRLEKIDHLVLIAIINGLFFVLLLILYFRKKQWQLMTMIVAFILMRVLFDLIILPIRATEELGFQEKEIAKDIYSITKDQSIHLYKNEMAFRSTIFYLERSSLKVVQLDSSASKNQFYLADLDQVDKSLPIETYYRFNHKGGKFGLIKFINE